MRASYVKRCVGGHPLFFGGLFGIAYYGCVVEHLGEVAFCGKCAHHNAVGCKFSDVGRGKQIRVGLDEDVQFAQDVLHHELYVHACLSGGGLSGTSHHPVCVGGVAEEFLHAVSGQTLQVMAVQGNALDADHVGGGVNAYSGIGLSLMGGVCTEVVLASLVPVLHGIVFPTCAVWVVGYGLVIEGPCGILFGICVPSPNTHSGGMVAEPVGVSCGCIVYIAARKTDGRILPTCFGWTFHKHVVLCATANQQCADAQQVCFKMLIHARTFFVNVLFLYL